ncbi:hypothetical protein K9N68_16355 [Kovacikia minuta CCNUW1]|uniref:hypothetical protein n=1 Tax=Kovacikia minuta TaxID=2931930 RepID=UPI001CCAFB1A|nr:hypothetical protein [Kovacikia minuta]UBF29262.1 hypothetical protein K9N68_16355 [Kovacikia minuta CCNUW1]
MLNSITKRDRPSPPAIAPQLPQKSRFSIENCNQPDPIAQNPDFFEKAIALGIDCDRLFSMIAIGHFIP